MRTGSKALHSHTTESCFPLGIVLSLWPSTCIIIIWVEWQEESPSSRRGTSWTNALSLALKAWISSGSHLKTVSMLPNRNPAAFWRMFVCVE